MTQDSGTVTGIFPGTRYDEYSQIDAINFSTLKHVERSPLHAYQQASHPTKQTPAMAIGSAIHTLVLEPNLFAQQFAVGLSVDRRSKVNQERWAKWEEEHPTQQSLKPADWEMIHRMADSVAKHPAASEILGGEGTNEVVMVWEDEKTGVLCKARIDRLTTYGDWSVLADLKSTKDASPSGFGREIARYKLQCQAAWYLAGAETLSPRDRRFLFIAVDKTTPYGVCVHELDFASIQVGAELNRRYLTKWVRCMESREWECFPSGIVTQTLPVWAQREIEEEDE